MSRILVKAPLAPYGGWGQDGIGLVQALVRSGNPPSVMPLETVPPLPVDVAELLTRPLRPPYDLLLAHVAADRCRLSPAERAACRSRVLWSMWEWTTFANHPEIDRIRADVCGYDAVIAYDLVSAGAFADLDPDVPPVVVVQGGFDPEPWPYLTRTWRPPVRFLVIGHMTDRKNPAVAVEAFGELLDELGPRRFDAELHVKFVDRTNALLAADSASSGSAEEADIAEPSRPFLRGMRGQERVVVHVGTWPRAALRALYGEMHCLLAPSRGEGKNLAALEFLATGAPVVATATGGHQMWLDESYAYPLRFRTRPATWPRPTMAAEEADADIEHLKELMCRVYTDLGEADRMGRRAAEVVPATCSWQAVLPRLRHALAEVGIPITV